MSDKNLSGPVAYWNKACDLDEGAFSYANDAGCESPLYSDEYVQSLLGRIESMAQAHIALQQLCEVYRSAYEEARGIVNPLIAEVQEKRIAELELDRDTWQAAALALRDAAREG